MPKHRFIKGSYGKTEDKTENINLKMANVTAHVEKDISFLGKCPFIEKANCTEGWVSLERNGSHGVRSEVSVNLQGIHYTKG